MLPDADRVSDADLMAFEAFARTRMEEARQCITGATAALGRGWR